jgi:aryl-alcohol dehydrogenase-like predicted oxidoreductase
LARGLLARPFDQAAESERAKNDPWIEYTVYHGASDAVRESSEATIRNVEEIAKAKGVSMADVSTAWVLSKGINPIIGLNSKKRIDEAVASVKVTLTPEEVKKLEAEYVARPVAPLW